MWPAILAALASTTAGFGLNKLFGDKPQMPKEQPRPLSSIQQAMQPTASADPMQDSLLQQYLAKIASATKGGGYGAF